MAFSPSSEPLIQNKKKPQSIYLYILFPIKRWEFYSLHVKKLVKVFSALTGFVSPGTIPLSTWSKRLCSKET